MPLSSFLQLRTRIIIIIIIITLTTITITPHQYYKHNLNTQPLHTQHTTYSLSPPFLSFLMSTTPGFHSPTCKRALRAGARTKPDLLLQSRQRFGFFAMKRKISRASSSVTSLPNGNPINHERVKNIAQKYKCINDNDNNNNPVIFPLLPSGLFSAAISPPRATSSSSSSSSRALGTTTRVHVEDSARRVRRNGRQLQPSPPLAVGR